MKGMLVFVLRSASDCTNGGITSKYDKFILVNSPLTPEIKIPEIFEESDRCPTLVLFHEYYSGMNGQPFKYRCRPLIDSPEGQTDYMFGGNYVDCSDGRMSRIGLDRPIPVHDRSETWATYEALSR